MPASRPRACPACRRCGGGRSSSSGSAPVIPAAAVMPPMWTGSPSSCRRCPGSLMRTDRLTFSRWLARDFALTVSVPASVGRSGPVPLTYYYPYSGQTPPGGVTGRLVDLGIYPPARVFRLDTAAFWAPARGGIALVRTAPPVFSLDLARPPTGGYVPGRTSLQAAADYTAYAAALAHPAWQGILTPVPLLDARTLVCSASSAPGPACRTRRSSTSTTRSSRPTRPPPGSPRPATPAARRCGSAKPPAPNCPGSPPAARPARPSCSPPTSPPARRPKRSGAGWKGSGNTGENIIINTHTDGPNATEENGGLGLLALARHLAGLPSRNRDMYFALVTGHFQLPQFTRTIPNPKRRGR